MGRQGGEEGSEDPRVTAVLAVLAGRPACEVAEAMALDAALVARWVRAFVDAGTAQVTNTPDPEAARQRDRFLAAFAHEIRTPLTVAQGWAHLLVEDDARGLDVGDSARRLDEALWRLEEVTLDVEMMTAASLGRLRLEPYPVPVGKLVEDLPGLTEVEGDGPDTHLYVDPDRFRPVLRDLWSAGWQRPVPRALHLVVHAVPGGVEVCVVRDADPIDPAVLQALFEPFDTNDDRTGITIGLYLARALAVAHGGTIGVDQDDDVATFWVRVPHPPSHLKETTMFRLACGDVMPGCSARFESADRDELLGQVAQHAAADHGITEITPDVLEVVTGKIQVG